MSSIVVLNATMVLSLLATTTAATRTRGVAALLLSRSTTRRCGCGCTRPAQYPLSSFAQQHSPPRHLAAVVNGGDDDKESPQSSQNKKQQQQQQRVGRTGWNHNAPDESSSFWVRGGGGGAGNQPPQTPPKRFRTGWLHNKAGATKTKEASAATSTPPSTNSLARQRLQRAMSEQARNHRIVAPPAFHTNGGSASIHPLVVTEHVIAVPLHHHDDDDDKSTKQETLDIYFSIVELVDSDDKRAWLQALPSLQPRQRAAEYVQRSKLSNADSLCLFLQGGPGFGGPTPVAALGLDSAQSSWAAQALYGAYPYQKVVLLDARGMGRSTPRLTKQVLQKQFPNLFCLDENDIAKDEAMAASTILDALQAERPEETALVRQAVQDVTEYMSHFRADSIVKDAELVREALLLPEPLEAEEDADDNKKKNVPKPWGACLGQSYGGFCLLTYLSQCQHPPQIGLFTGGLAPICNPNLKEVYTGLWKRVQRRSLLYYQQYPGDVALVKRIVQRLLHQPEPLPSGGRLTARRFLQLGLNYLGSSPSSFAAFHALLASALLNGDDDTTNLVFHKAFLQTVDASQSFDAHPIYYWMHESIYANGPGAPATAWAAHEAYQDLVQQKPEIWDYRKTSSSDDDDALPTLFFGEMVFPWMSAGDYAELSGLGLQLLAQALADKADWGPLYDADQMAKAPSRLAAAVYFDDLYVDFDESLKLVRGDDAPLPHCAIYVTNEYQHSGLRDDGAAIFCKLHGMATGSTRIPS